MHCSGGVKPECNLSAATLAETIPFTDVPNSTQCAQLLHISTLCSALSSRISSLWVQSFVAKAAVRFIWVSTSTEWYITNTIGIIKASWHHRLTNRLSLYVQHPAVSGPRDFQFLYSAVLQIFVHGSCDL